MKLIDAVVLLLLFIFPFNHGLGVKKCCLDGQLLDAETLLCVPNTLPPERMTHFLPSYMINMTSEDLMTMQSKVHKNIQSGHMPQCQRWEDDEYSVWKSLKKSHFASVWAKRATCIYLNLLDIWIFALKINNKSAMLTIFGGKIQIFEQSLTQMRHFW